MRHFDWRWLAVSSALLVALAARAETRPQYGGTLHVALRAAPLSLDPADGSQADSFARRSLTMLMFDTLVTMDESGHARPSLAASWQPVSSTHGWQFRLRHGIKFHDGSSLTGDIAAASLHAANPSWNVSADGDALTIEGIGSEVLAELARPRNAIAKRGDSGRPSGTGPFHIADWQPARKLTLAAEESCWRGRPFLDGIEVELGKSFRDQMTALELGKADLVEIAPEQSHRAALDGRLLVNSLPMELIALLFSRDAKSADEKMLREALALSIERGSIRSVLLQGSGQPAASILPTWMSGYGFVFPAEADLPRARRAREQVRTVPTWTIAYDASDPVARLLTERIALNARDVGLSLQPTTAPTADLRLARIPLASADPWISLADVAAGAGVAAKDRSGSVESLYAAEQSLLATQRLVPLFHLPASNAASANLKNWTLRSDGTWSLADAWLDGGKP